MFFECDEKVSKEMYKMELSERLQFLRKKEDFSQEQLADMLGISRQAVSKWESGQGKPEIDNIIKLTQIYNVSADYILLGKEEITENKTEVSKNTPQTSNKTINTIAVIGASAVITVFFIFALMLLAKYL